METDEAKRLQKSLKGKRKRNQIEEQSEDLMKYDEDQKPIDIEVEKIKESIVKLKEEKEKGRISEKEYNEKVCEYFCKAAECSSLPSLLFLSSLLPSLISRFASSPLPPFVSSPVRFSLSFISSLLGLRSRHFPFRSMFPFVSGAIDPGLNVRRH